MWYFIVLAVLHSGCVQANTLLQECAKYYRPKNYLDLLPNLNLPYINQMPVPNNMNKIRNKDYFNKLQNIAASPVMTTKVLTVKTKYFYKNPICVKYSKKQKMCKSEDGRIRENVDKLITKENFLKNNDNIQQEVISEFDVISEEDDYDVDKFNLKVSFGNLEPSEIADNDQSRAFQNTPSMSPQKLNQLLIEDRLDQLETILPNCQRRRVFETSTIYVTKTLTNKRRMATLVVKNCVPIGYEACPKKQKSRRKSKVAERSEDSKEKLFYFG